MSVVHLHEPRNLLLRYKARTSCSYPHHNHRIHGRETTTIGVCLPCSHDAKDVDDREGHAQEYQECSSGVRNEDQGQNQHRQETQAQSLVQFLVNDLERLPLKVADAFASAE